MRPNAMAIDGYHFVLPLQVRWSEVDGQQIVYHAHYLMYMDCAWSAYLKQGVKLIDKPVAYTVIAKTTLEYRSSARYEDLLGIGVRVQHIGRTSLQVEFAIERDGERLLDGHTVYVFVGEGGDTPMPVTDEWRRVIADYEGALPGSR